MRVRTRASSSCLRSLYDIVGASGAGSSTTIETTAMTDLDAKIKELGTIDIKIGNEIYPNITGVKNTPGVPKSDF